MKTIQRVSDRVAAAGVAGVIALCIAMIEQIVKGFG